MNRISTPRRFIRSTMNRVIDSIAAAPWVLSTDKGRLIETSMPPDFSFTLSTNSLSAAARSASDCSRQLHSPVRLQDRGNLACANAEVAGAGAAVGTAIAAGVALAP
jgi:hypothetical protein